MLSCKELRSEARASLAGNWGTAIGITLVYLLLLEALSGTGVGYILLYGPLAVGLHVAFIQLFRQRKMSVDCLFGQFDNFGNTLVTGLLHDLFIGLWMLLFIVPGIVKAYSYAMTFFIAADNPQISGSEAITRSRNMMNGHKAELFLLDVSFIGWHILGILSFGIGYIWITPYQQAAHARFYEALLAEGQSGGVVANESTIA